MFSTSNPHQAQEAEAPVVICAKDVHKKFRIYHDKGVYLKDRIVSLRRGSRTRYDDNWVLQGISICIRKGEAIGLIGENGCGKSTFLKMLTRIMYPDHGTIEITGRVSSLIELGAGFHPDLSGRENIYTNASIFGLSKAEIDRRVGDIIKFSGLEDYIDNPVHTYSSGMYMRLAFSVAINVNADILLIDEILAVGDANFQTKCFKRLREIKAQGTTIVIVSHDLDTIQRFCDKALWISDGKAVSFSTAKDTVESYRQYMSNKYIQSIRDTEKEAETEAAQDEAAPEAVPGETAAPVAAANASPTAAQEPAIDYTANRFGLRYVEITDVKLLDKNGNAISTFVGGEPADIDLYYQVNQPLDDYVFGIGFYTMDDVCIYGGNTQMDNLSIPSVENTGKIRFHLDHMPLLTGSYYLHCSIVEGTNGIPMDYYRHYCTFDVQSGVKAIGCCSIDHQWTIQA